MGFLSSDHKAGVGYPVREFPRGPLIGRVKTVGYRRWRAACSVCIRTFTSDRRVTSSRMLGAHYQFAHVRKT